MSQQHIVGWGIDPNTYTTTADGMTMELQSIEQPAAAQEEPLRRAPEARRHKVYDAITPWVLLCPRRAVLRRFAQLGGDRVRGRPTFDQKFTLPPWMGDHKPPADQDRFLTPEEALLISGYQFARSIWGASTCEPGDGRRTVVMQLDRPSDYTDWPAPLFRVEFLYPQTQPLLLWSHREVFGPPEINHALRVLGMTWPLTLDQADSMQRIAYTPSIQHFQWLHNQGRGVDQTEITRLALVPGTPPSHSRHPLSTRGVVEAYTGAEITGSIWYSDTLHYSWEDSNTRKLPRSRLPCQSRLITGHGPRGDTPTRGRDNKGRCSEGCPLPRPGSVFLPAGNRAGCTAR